MKNINNICYLLIGVMSTVALFASEPAAKKQKNGYEQAMAIPSQNEFIQAIIDGDVQKVSHFIEHNADIDFSNREWEDEREIIIPLMYAGLGNSLPIFVMILSKTVYRDSDKIALIMDKIAKDGCARSVEFIEQLMVRRAEPDENTLLNAIEGCNKPVVNFLLENHKQKLNWENNKFNFFTHAMESIGQSKTEQQKECAQAIAMLLLQQGVDIHQADHNGFLHLHDAIGSYVSVDAVRFLLDHDAYIDLQNVASHPDFSQETPLIMAIETRKAIVAPEDNTPEAKAQAQLLTVQKRGKLMSIIQLLVNRGASLVLTNISASANIWLMSPLMEASIQGDFEVVKFLVESEADIGLKNHEGKTALDLAKEYYVKELEPDTKDQFRHVIDYLTNPVEYAHAQIAGILVQNSLMGPVTDRKIMPQIKIALSKKSIESLKAIFIKDKQAFHLTDEHGVDVPMLAIKANFPEAVAFFITNLPNDTDTKYVHTLLSTAQELNYQEVVTAIMKILIEKSFTGPASASAAASSSSSSSASAAAPAAAPTAMDIH